jgi:hypothetical protein
MSSDQCLDRLLEKVQRLRQSNETWEGASRLGRTWITPRNMPAYRPYLILVTNTAGAILRSQVMEESPTSDHMLEELLNAMLHPALGSGVLVILLQFTTVARPRTDAGFTAVSAISL